MISLKFDITVNDDDKNFILKKQNEYSCAFRMLYKNIDKIKDDVFLHFLTEKYNIPQYLKNCLIIDTKVKHDQVYKQKEKLESEIIVIESEIKKLKLSVESNNGKNKKNTRLLFKLNKKLEHKIKQLPKDITFGGLNLLRKISYLSNDKIKNKDKIIAAKKEYNDNRLLPINYIGSLNDSNSNRYFVFDFDQDKIIYKPSANKKIEIGFKVSKGIKKQLLKLFEVKDLKILPISVKLTSTYIVITYDEQILNGYGFDVRGYKNELKNIDKSNKEYRHEVAVKYKKEQESRMSKGKLANRYCSIDLNPEYIGVSILDKTDNGEIKIIDKFVYDLSLLLKKSNNSSEDKSSKYLNNKRKYEIGVIYANLFKKVKHYNCANFVMEDINFKSKPINDKPVEFNRKTKNVWNLNYQINLINKHCNVNGIKLIEVNPYYSSFIGNLMYNYFDPLNAAIEIGRRGMFKYIKGNSFYPVLSETIIDTAISKIGLSDVQWLKAGSWLELYKKFKETGIRYRWQLCEVKHSCFSGFNIKSRWELINFS